MSNQYRVSQSKVKTYLRCRQAYHYKYVLKLKAKKKSRPLQFGTMIHGMIENYCNGEDPFGYFDTISPQDMAMIEENQDDFGDIITDCRDIMTGYLEEWSKLDKKEHRFLRKAGQRAEHHFEIELLPDVIWNGKIDALIKTRDYGLRVIVEHKSFGNSMPGEDARWRDLQPASYFRACEMLGWGTFDGFYWDYIKSSPPKIPGVLKDGKLSQKSIDTLPCTVKRVIEERGERVSDYPSLMASAKANQEKRFTRISSSVSPQVVDYTFENFTRTVKEMVDNHGKPPIMSVDKHCSWCDYQPLCRARLQGNDFDFIKEREYIDESQKPKEDKSTGGPIHSVCHSAVKSFEDEKG